MTTTTTTTTTTTVLLPRFRAVIVTVQLCGLMFFSSFCNGIVVVALPAMQSGLGLDEGLLVWPSSSYYLTAGSCLLLAGSIADAAGAKRVQLVGSLLAAAFTLGCGLARTGGELIAFRALQGVTNAIISPSSISIISSSLEEGRPRNMGFACLGFSQPLGFGVGLVLAGVLTDTIGWRPAFYLAAAASLALFLLSIWALPPDPRRPEADQPVWRRLALHIDWVGLLFASTGLAMLSYVLASMSSDINNIHQAPSIVLLVISGFSIPAFAAWMHYQSKNNRTALIPNSLWRSRVFTSSCILILLTNAITNCMELYSSLFFQQVQGISALGASIRVLPSLLAGVLTSILTGIFVNRMPVLWTVLISSALSATAPLLMAFIRTDQVYWENAFFGQILSPISCDMLFTVGLLIISDVYPKHMQALGGAVFNTCAQLGAAVGLSVAQVVASSVTSNVASSSADKSSPDALMKGYRAAFWLMFGCMVAVCFVSALGLRKVGVIGVKRD
ncbi:uncharacterized protein THITE_2051060 [Thermothielavioides terrestris NRRL 8126]|uniref:Major facilitator superfamily (MFS) profile domain-containing protein n=2 Tax=Thermothielavioides terrestris TaxID=2587410 RepID=G2R7Q9_THETT|nr:uncharacterized protein THITE_2051060 [Thermothielavioides terrestris NRRL 8126]AEO67968.1 hypothetical protein THITE_2051060 [Thermothielavioides terrestris NRRL 8126]